MGRVSDEERRKVAENLRESAGNAEVLRDVFLEEILAGDMRLWFAEDIEIDILLYHLADLIEPSCDRDALLALADEMTVEKGDIWRWSGRIREALGVDDA